MSGQGRVAVLWEKGPVQGEVRVEHGALASVAMAPGRASGGGTRFGYAGSSPPRLALTIGASRVALGAGQTRVSVHEAHGAFSFFLRDVTREFPLFIPEYGVVVTVGHDTRDYAAIVADSRARGLVSDLQQIEAEPEETFEAACHATRHQVCPTWLGLSRDMRLFEIGYDPKCGYWGYVRPRYHHTAQVLPGGDGPTYDLAFVVGPGASCRTGITRRLEDGVLPILRARQAEQDVLYDLTAFVTLETRPLELSELRGSDWQACYPNAAGNMLSKEEHADLEGLMAAEMRQREEETVCRVRVEATNTGAAPRYAWLKGLGLAAAGPCAPPHHESRTGGLTLVDGAVAGVTLVNGKPAAEEEMAVLLQPGEAVIWDLLIPHQPISVKRARALSRQDFTVHMAACRTFRRAKLESAALVSVPEPAIDERIRAGLLHCDLVAFGREPNGPVLATIGVYAPIGSESAPIIQFFDSMGWHKLAERACEFFLARQRPDGFIQNFGGYQLETGPALWTMGEHYRYTGDEAWVRRIKPKLLKGCEFLLAWRNRNKRDELRGAGYGLLDGKVADPEDFFHSFMLNALSYLGIQRVAEMLTTVDPAESRRLAREARAFRADIRTAYAEALARAPVIPLGDGTWTPSVPPWPESAGPVALYAEEGDWFSHGTFGTRDSLIGALYLVIGEVLEPDETGADFLLRSHQQLFTTRNAGFSQPYYCRHDFIHVARGDVKPFLKTFYNQVAGLQDRETYTFWEHYFTVSPHKTHEEGWFLMQTRWMLWLEQGTTLSLLRTVPRQWLQHGKRICLRKVASHFGPLTLEVESAVRDGRIEAHVVCKGVRRPKTVTIRLPHPDGRKPVDIAGGAYDAQNETVRIARFSGAATVRLTF